MDFFCFCVAEEGWGGMEIEWRWIIGSVGFGRGQQGETLAEGGGWVGRNVTEMGEGMGEGFGCDIRARGTLCFQPDSWRTFHYHHTCRVLDLKADIELVLCKVCLQ